MLVASKTTEQAQSRLDDDERERWRAATDEFRRLYARSASLGDESGSPLSDRLKLLLIKRARILKSARAKVGIAARVMEQAYRPGQRWIVYCDNQDQLAEVRASIASAGVSDVYEYHSAMIGDPVRTLEVFGERGGVVVSIRCLDEGVDIPSVTHALILASSKNPREFIQRRGRVLRKFPGKSLAHLHDVVVVPEDDDEEGIAKEDTIFAAAPSIEALERRKGRFRGIDDLVDEALVEPVDIFVFAVIEQTKGHHGAGRRRNHSHRPPSTARRCSCRDRASRRSARAARQAHRATA